MKKEHFDVAVMGSGPGGYPAAIRLAQKGKKVALIEATAVGGTCLNRGCIPTKALIARAEVLHNITRALQFGIKVGTPTVDFNKMSLDKDAVVNSLRKSLEGLIVANGITIIKGYAKFTSPKELKISGETESLISADNIIIATGSEPKEIPSFAFDGKQIHSSTTILEQTTLPKSIAIIGGGVIGVEFASLYHELGVKVTLIEALPRILPLECETLSSFLTKSFQKRGLQVITSAMVDTIKKSGAGIEVVFKDGKTTSAEIALVAIGRSVNTTAIGLDLVKVKTDKGFILIDEHMQTNIPGIYAIGDITGKAMYAHVATHQGFVAADHILGSDEVHMNYDAIPGVIFTYPEIGTCGLSLETALSRGYKAKRSQYPFQALGKAQAANQTEGFAQIVVDETTGQILGAQVAGHEASNLIAPMATAITNELTVESIVETIHAHPTLQEAWLESALLSLGTPLHFPPLKKVTR